MKKQTIKLSESTLKEMIKEAINEIGKNWTPEQFAYLTGKANGSIGNRDGLFKKDAAYNARKERQARLFANMASQRMGNNGDANIQDPNNNRAFVSPNLQNLNGVNKGALNTQDQQGFNIHTYNNTNIGPDANTSKEEHMSPEEYKEKYGANEKNGMNPYYAAKSLNHAFNAGQVAGKNGQAPMTSLGNQQRDFNFYGQDRYRQAMEESITKAIKKVLG